jgi:hypothetical protein
VEDFKYPIWFPPHKQIVTTLISYTNYFKMCKEGVMVSLKAWNGDIDPYDALNEAWVQTSGIPPKWCNWKTFRQVASSLGKMVVIDWNSLFTRSDSEVLNSCVEVKDRDVSRSKEFRSQCASCQGDMNMEGSMENI